GLPEERSAPSDDGRDTRVIAVLSSYGLRLSCIETVSACSTNADPFCEALYGLCQFVSGESRLRFAVMTCARLIACPTQRLFLLASPHRQSRSWPWMCSWTTSPATSRC